MKIVVDRDIPFVRGVLEPFAEVVYLPGDGISADDVQDASALLVRTRTLCNARLLAGSSVKFIGTATIGYDHIDTDFCTSAGIEVATAAGSNARGVLQWVSAALAWLASERGLQPHKTTLGVVGVGHVGSLVAKYASAWGFRVMCSDPMRERSEGLGATEGFYPLRTIARECDVITFHVPLTAQGQDATQGLVAQGFLSEVRPDAVIINSSRGAVIDPDALHEWVDRRGFILDVWNGEPDIDPYVSERVLLGTPHIAGYSLEGKATATAMVVNALARKFRLPLKDWFPEGAPKSKPRKISWEQMRRTIPDHFDIVAESAALKAAPEKFEEFRRDYEYRKEYF